MNGSHYLKKKYILITGGAGFIGTNLADRLLESGERVLIYDNLSRAGAEENLKWISSKHGKMVQFIMGDVNDTSSLGPAVKSAAFVFHFAAQVAVTTSLVNPMLDFDTNARGTLSLLECLRSLKTPPPIIYTSTNKIYGGLKDVQLVKKNNRYIPADRKIMTCGIGENRPVDFHSPYGCSKGASDMYVLDYARTFGLKALVFRMSCIYGPHQFGTEDQGWVAHFLINSMKGLPITIYGDGMQVRDILYIDDLVDAFLLASGRTGDLSGQAFNIGGGMKNTVSLLELLDLIEGLTGGRPETRSESWRTADQRYYVSDISKFGTLTGWEPKINFREGVKRLHSWLAGARKDKSGLKKTMLKAALQEES